jgi:hypothetical protein
MKLKKIVESIFIEKGKWTMIPHEEIDQFEKRIFDLISAVYAPIGGNPNFKTPSDVKNAKNDYEALELNQDGQPEAVSVSKHQPAGTKLVATAHDGSKEAIRTVLRHKIELLNHTGYFAEVSGRVKDILLANNVPVVDDEETVKKLSVGKKLNGMVMEHTLARLPVQSIEK